MSKKKQTQPKKEQPKKEEPKKKPTDKVKTKIGEVLMMSVGQMIFRGQCVAERDMNGEEQVFLKLNGVVSRWFNAKDIV